jgi:hypothetical protein
VFADDDDDEQYIELENLSPGQAIELIELSFFQTCFTLSEGDVEPLKLFIVAFKTAAKKHEGASASAITHMVNSLSPPPRRYVLWNQKNNSCVTRGFGQFV